ncbi:FAD-dependent monooxygenase [Paractinoplanes atraurantiacus]|uniref:2-polyprenyl-6-methoxyphenol hydroxylase n=1 Tax=Paractinoplanes atraurantiacus TaxID=1036182 RepID=A0A285H6Z1_9ACTN|nr:FAD-dependent monooxygenase [Actinoplanes atraurantiacus]SNY31374.1 2-polyprenyl-6-methoxyphenol hydroxylase [Actinoplanes atraurantiacus]
MSTQGKALVVGLGIAGMATAIRLKEAGWQPVIVERSPERRTGGYFIGMFPEGVAAAQRLGVYDEIVKRTMPDVVNWEINADGERKPGMGFADQPGKPQSVLRGDIEAGLWTKVDGQIEVRFDTSPDEIFQSATGVMVTLRTGSTGETRTEPFDLVVGADGMRSTVRRLVFGPDEKFLKPMEAMICAFQMSRQLPGLGDREAAIVSEPKRSMWIFTMEDTPPTVLLTYRTKNIDEQFTSPAPQVLREVFAGVSAGGLIEAAIDELERAPQMLFDSVNQVRMDRWHEGRVVLVGDAAWCLTLYSGMGATAGMLGGATLGDKLAENPGEVTKALAAFDAELRPLMTKHQQLALHKSQLFVPSNVTAHWLRKHIVRAITAKGAREREKAAAGA